MRAIIGASLRFRLLVVAIAAARHASLGFTQLRDAPVDVLPEFTPPYVEVQTEALGLSAEEVEQLITVPLEADLLNGVAVARRDPLRSRCPACRRSSCIFEPGTDLYRARGSSCRSGSRRRTRCPNVSKPPQMLQPLSSTSRVMMIGLSLDEAVADRDVGPRPLDDPAAAAGRPRRGQRLDLGPARPPAPGAGRPASGCATRASRSTRSSTRPATPCWVSPLTLPRGLDAGHRRLHRHAEPAAGIQHILADHDARAICARADRRDAGAGSRCASATSPTVVEDHQPLIGDAVVNDGAGPAAGRREVPGREHARGDARRRGGARRAAAGPLRACRSTPTVFRPADFIEQAIDNLDARAARRLRRCWRSCCSACCSAWRTALVGLAAFAVVAGAAVLVLDLSRASTFNALVFAGLSRRSACVIDDAVVDVDTSPAGCATSRADRRRPTAASSSRPVADARSPLGYATLIIAARRAARPLHRRA